MINAISQQTTPNIYKVGFKRSSNTPIASNNDNQIYTPEEKKMIKNSALLGGVFCGSLGTGLIMLWNQLSKNKDANMPATKLKPKEEALITIVGALFLTTIGAIVNSIQAKRAINIMHNTNNVQDVSNSQ